MAADNSYISVTVTNKVLHQVGRVIWATAPSERHMVHALKHWRETNGVFAKCIGEA